MRAVERRAKEKAAKRKLMPAWQAKEDRKARGEPDLPKGCYDQPVRVFDAHQDTPGNLKS